MTQKLFEVFLGTYNAEPWIEQAIHALEDQDCPPFSIKIIDNDSVDNTVAIIENIFSKYSLKNDYTLLRNHKNIGPISSFLDRLDEFKGEWVIMIHQDDLYHSNHISTLIKPISEATNEVGVIFTAMGRVDGDGLEKIPPPTLSSRLSESDRLENFMMSLQLSPVNFPACAIKKVELARTTTSRHTTAFNDIEMLLRIMCVSDINYIPIETMHYRIYSGNAASITSNFANDRAVFVGLVELFHSREVQQVLTLATTPGHWKKLTASIEQALTIRLANIELRNLARNIIAENLVRQFGYENLVISNFLKDSLEALQLPKEAQVVENLSADSRFSKIDLKKSIGGPEYLSSTTFDSSRNSDSFVKVMTKFPLPVREALFNSIFRSYFFAGVRRPFVKVWRLRGRNK